MLKQQLQQKLQQKLSPQQIQLIRLLELPAIELEERIKHELEDNPALEEGKDIADDFERTDDEGVDDITTNETDTDLSLGDYMREDDIPDYKLREISEKTDRKEDIPFSVSQSLNEYLLQQLGLRDLPEKEMKIAEYIIGNIDDDGYLRRELSAIADDLVFQAGQDVNEKEIEEVLTIIQDFDPAGVGARNLQECLLLQLDRKESTPGVKMAIHILTEYFEEFTQLDNGVGMLTLLSREFARGLDLMEPEEMEGAAPVAIATGVAAAPFLERLVEISNATLHGIKETQVLRAFPTERC